MVLVGGGVAIWYFSVRPTAAAQESSLVVNLLAFAYPLASMLVLFGVTTVLLRRPIDGNRLGLRAVGDRRVGGRRCRPHLQPGAARGRQPERELGRRRLPDLLRHADRQRASSTGSRPVARRAGHRAVAVTRFQPISPLPYLAVATAYVLLLVVALRPWTDPISGLVLGALLVTGRWWCSASCWPCGRTCGCSPSTRRGRTRPASARWCSTRPTSSSSPGPTARSAS